MPATGGDNDVVLQLRIGGVKEAEARQAAAGGAKGISAEIEAALERHVALHKMAYEATTRDAKAAANEEIKYQKAKVAALAGLLKQIQAEERKAESEKVRAAAVVAREVERQAKIEETAKVRASRVAETEARRAEATRTREAAAASREIERLAKQEERERVRATRAAEAEAKRADREMQAIGKAHTAAIIENAKREEAAKKSASKAMVEAARAVEKANRDQAESQSRMLQNLANATIVAQGFVGFVKGAVGSLKQFSEEISTTTNIYGSLQGSISEARDAVQGTVADIDLIVAKNQALNAGLEITDKQFGLLARAADDYADSIGINTKEALQQVINGLVNGNEKMLKRLGIVRDVDEVEKEYAATIGKRVEMMTAEEKQTGKLQDALKRLEGTAKAAGSEQINFATQLEREGAEAKNVWEGIKNTIGSLKFPAEFLHWFKYVGTKDPAAVARASDADLKRMRRDVLLNSPEYTEIKAEADRRAAARDAERAAFSSRINDAVGKEAGLAAYGGEAGATEVIGPDGKPYMEYSEDPTTKARIERATFLKTFSKKQSNVVYEAPSSVTGLNRLLYKAAIEEQERLAKLSEEAADAALERIRREETERGAELSSSKGAEQLAFVDREDAKAQAQMPLFQIKKYKTESGVFLDPWMQEVQNAVEESRQKAGGGLIAQLMFGDDTSLDQTYARMDEFKKRSIEMVGEMTDYFEGAAQATTAAAGHAIGAYLSEGAAAGVSAKQVFHELTKGLAEQSAAKALWEGVQAGANLVIGNLPGAAMHGKAALIYGGFAASMGAASRASFSAPSAAGSTPTNVRSSAGGTTSTGRSSGGGDTINLTVVVNGGFQTEEEQERSIDKLVASFERRTGRKAGERN